VQDEIHALRVQAAGNPGPDAVGAAGDQGYLSSQCLRVLRHRMPPCLMGPNYPTSRETERASLEVFFHEEHEE